MVDTVPDGHHDAWGQHFTPGRPITEPPLFDYEEFIEERVPSDFRMKLLFPDDIEKRTRYRDTFTEFELLGMYQNSIPPFLHISKDTKLGKFYGEFHKELGLDFVDLWEEFVEVERAKTRDMLALWEYEHLDQDGGTRKLEQDLRDGRDVSWMAYPKRSKNMPTLCRSMNTTNVARGEDLPHGRRCIWTPMGEQRR